MSEFKTNNPPLIGKKTAFDRELWEAERAYILGDINMDQLERAYDEIERKYGLTRAENRISYYER